MNAPDKIFLHKVRDEESSGYHKMWFESRGRLVPSEEYIRKDALLEWAKEKKKQLFEQESTNDEPSDVAAGINAGLDMLIGKLNSM